MKSICLIVASGLLAAAAPALAGGDPVDGKRLFLKCAPCHSVEKDVSKVGPSLYGVVDRPAASLLSFPYYSNAMRAFGSAGNKWDEAALTAYLKAPAREFLPGTNMAFAGFQKRPQDIADVIAYLRTTNAPQ